MDDDGLNQAEHEQISTSLEVERIEVNLFRSKSLWVPLRARGVFGGLVLSTLRFALTTDNWYRQVISQALVSATNCVDSGFALHVGTFIQFHNLQNSLVRLFTVITCVSFSW